MVVECRKWACRMAEVFRRLEFRMVVECRKWACRMAEVFRRLEYHRLESDMTAFHMGHPVLGRNKPAE